MQKKIIILASGGGSNAQKIIEYFQKRDALVHSVLCNRKQAGVYSVAASHNVPCHWMSEQTDDFLSRYLAKHSPDVVVLAGYLKKIPASLAQAHTFSIINIHPALLPKFGGKGMYGMHVHRAVKAAGEAESGITIHYVNAHYDEGEIIFQARVDLAPTDTAEAIAQKVLKLEHAHYAPTIERILKTHA